MKKRKQILATVLMLLVLLMGNVFSVSAMTAQTTDNGVVIDDGYTEDGIHYTVYAINDEGANGIGITPFARYTWYTSVKVEFSGKVTPSSTYSPSIIRNGLTYTGTLSLVSYNNAGTGPSLVTIAYYEGWLFAWDGVGKEL